jgi:lipopolysaccharide biosynthesis regulator YciM
LDATNWIANYHLGLIEMSERDFASASRHLAVAYQQKPGHRGIIKNLGYSYAWLGETDKACLYLGMIPEAESELDVYIWWWDTQGRQDLSANAGLLASRLKPANVQQ